MKWWVWALIAFLAVMYFNDRRRMSPALLERSDYIQRNAVHN